MFDLKDLLDEKGGICVKVAVFDNGNRKQFLEPFASAVFQFLQSRSKGKFYPGMKFNCIHSGS